MSETPWGFKELVQDAKTRVTCMGVQEVKARCDAGEAIHIIDIREDNEFAAAHAVGALHIGKGVLERDIDKHFPDRNVTLALYCGGGSRSALAADALLKMGYTDVISVDGGFKGWKEAGFPIED